RGDPRLIRGALARRRDHPRLLTPGEGDPIPRLTQPPPREAGLTSPARKASPPPREAGLTPTPFTPRAGFLPGRNPALGGCGSGPPAVVGLAAPCGCGGGGPGGCGVGGPLRLWGWGVPPAWGTPLGLPGAAEAEGVGDDGDRARGHRGARDPAVEPAERGD